MDADFEWTTRGDPAELAARLYTIAAAVDTALAGRAEVVGVTIRDAAKARAPVDTGKLQASIDYEVDQQGAATLVFVGTDVEYAVFVERGTAPHEITGDPLAFPGASGETVFAYSVDHPGTPAQPFLRPAFRDAVYEVRDALADTVEVVFDE